MSKNVKYAVPGSAEYVEGKWALSVQQYLSYISEDTGISMKELILKMNVELASDENITGLLFNVTEDKAFEMFVFKTIDDESDPIDATLADVVVVRKLLKDAVDDIGKNC